MHLDWLPNVTIHEPTPLDRLPMSRVLAAFIPNQRKRDADAVELPSKMLQLLAYGLPIVKTAMPNAVKAEFIILVQTDPALDAAIDGCFRNFSRGNRASARSSHSTRQKPASPPFESSPDADTARRKVSAEPGVRAKPTGALRKHEVGTGQRPVIRPISEVGDVVKKESGVVHEVHDLAG